MSDKQPPDDLIGQTIAGRYRIISRLGAGGMGVAYRAWDEEEGRPVVIKIPKRVFLEDPKFAERFAREIRLLQGLRHPHIVPIVDVGEHDGLPYVVMRFLPGGSLSNRRLRDEDGKVRPNPPGMLHLWLPDVADALDHVHANGVVHRDVKPANIFFDAYWNAFLGDFGIAKIVEESDSFDREHTLTATNMGIGTQEYMGPELFTPKPVLDGRTDQYALAVMAYEMVSGTRPFTGTTAHLIVEVTTQPVPRLDRAVRGLPVSLVEAVHRGLAKAPGERFGTCREFADHVLRDVPLLADEPDIARLLCPKCSNILKLPIAAAGQKGKCPKCQTTMKVADDLGALWLLDEARRQRRAAESVGEVNHQEIDQEPAEAGDEIEAEALEVFKPISSTTPIKRAQRRQSKKASTGMILGGVAAVVVALAGLRTISLPGGLLDRIFVIGGRGKPAPESSKIERLVDGGRPYPRFTLPRGWAERDGFIEGVGEVRGYGNKAKGSHNRLTLPVILLSRDFVLDTKLALANVNGTNCHLGFQTETGAAGGCSFDAAGSRLVAFNGAAFDKVDDCGRRVLEPDKIYHMVFRRQGNVLELEIDGAVAGRATLKAKDISAISFSPFRGTLRIYDLKVKSER